VILEDSDAVAMLFVTLGRCRGVV